MRSAGGPAEAPSVSTTLTDAPAHSLERARSCAEPARARCAALVALDPLRILPLPARSRRVIPQRRDLRVAALQARELDLLFRRDMQIFVLVGREEERVTGGAALHDRVADRLRKLLEALRPRWEPLRKTLRMNDERSEVRGDRSADLAASSRVHAGQDTSCSDYSVFASNTNIELATFDAAGPPPMPGSSTSHREIRPRTNIVVAALDRKE